MSDALLSPDAPLMAAVRGIEATRRRMAVVVDAENRLLGTLTDGDVRRCLLAGGSLETPLSQAMNSSPLLAEEGAPAGYLLDLMRKRNVMALPVVDSEGRFKRLVHLIDLEYPEHFIPVTAEFDFAVIMAGGEGTRLRPLTATIPKPMVDIGGAPLLERQIESLAKAGLRRIYLSLNYLGHVIEEHFGDGAGFGVEIRYLREQEKLGTAGALALLPEKPSRPIVVMNGDILTTSDFGSLYTFHQAHAAQVTVAAVDYRISIPYGVINTEGAFATGLVEKPSQRFLCNAGIYAVSPQALDLLQGAGHLNMTDIIDSCFTCGMPVAVFPVHEYWSDIGTPDDLEKARTFFAQTVQDND
ncbi:nucleotidyltransferase family protein [Ferribacterium limneticum]|uniref:nucleotidyltransferase family protein n=1 Tax=Ferribacterium limneticum TaxID=76259 RepID=UPI001CFB7DA6|nr:nucleotidyltransferase family protein [Ferribacterium limneticum]UCV28969.1 nucleotidyltransferase family protein [Ferribacterium limneticum]UCV32887.1 nucleotidyltransferase family protein [Ferribacterium limneticum]